MEKDDINTLLKKWKVSPHSSLDLSQLKKEYSLNPVRWNKAFDFLQQTDLGKIAVGKYKLEGDDLFVNVDEYTTRDEVKTKYESHKVYADIQYLVSGEERIGVSTLDKMEPLSPYDPNRDIAFYKSKSNVYHLADAKHFFIFFPTDPHRPCVEVSENIPVRKVVVKVKLAASY